MPRYGDGPGIMTGPGKWPQKSIFPVERATGVRVGKSTTNKDLE